MQLLNTETKENKLNELEKLYNFMRQFLTKNNYTHKIINEPFGNYNIPEDKEKEFINLYTDAVIAGYKLSIAEKHSYFGPIVIELRFEQENIKKQYSNDMIIKLIKEYNIIIKKYLNVESINLCAYIFETSEPFLYRKINNDIIKIIYPYICTKPSLQYIMRNDLIKMITIKKIFDNMELKNKINEIFNDKIINYYDWLMYGSNNLKNVTLNLTHIYEYANKKIYDSFIPYEINNTRFIKQLIKILSIRKFKNEKSIININYINEKEKITSDMLDIKIENNLKELLNDIYEMSGISDNNLAKLFYHKYPNLFIYDPLAITGSNKKDGTWLTYNEYGIYKICDGMEKAKILLSTEIYKILKNDFEERLFILSEKINNNHSLDKKDKEKMIKNFKKKGEQLLLKVKNTSSKHQIIQQLKEFYMKEKIFEKLDITNPYLVGFENGVFDLQKKIFRKANADDFIYNTTGYNYNEPKKEFVDELNEIIKNIYPDKNERKYNMTIFSFSLSGIMHLQEFYMIIGNGGNGKGIITLLINITLGQIYCTTLSIECFKISGKMSANEKSQQLAGCKNARSVFVTECNFKEDEEFESNILKNMSGGDEQNCKFLYKEQTRYIPKFNLYFITNEQIPIKIKDKSVPRRARICPHRISFVDEHEYEKHDKSQSLAIPGLEEKLRKNPEYKYAFFKILLDYYTDFLNNDKKLDIPQSLVKENINFKRLNDPIGNFIDDCLIVTKCGSDRINTSHIFTIFKEYTCQSNVSHKSIKQYFEKRNIETIIIHGYSMYSGIKFQSFEYLKNKLNPNTIDKLIQYKMIHLSSDELDEFNKIKNKLDIDLN